MSDNSQNDHNRGTDNPPGMGGLFDGMANLIGKLGELAEKGEELKRSGHFQSSDGKDIQGEYGFSVRFGPGGQRSDEVHVSPTKKATNGSGSSQKQPASPEDREPHVDVFEEDDHVLVVAEMPGIAVEDVTVNFNGRTMALTGSSTRVRFRKMVELPRSFSPEDVEIAMNNGVVEIRLVLPTE